MTIRRICKIRGYSDPTKRGRWYEAAHRGTLIGSPYHASCEFISWRSGPGNQVPDPVAPPQDTNRRTGMRMKSRGDPAVSAWSGTLTASQLDARYGSLRNNRGQGTDKKVSPPSLHHPENSPISVPTLEPRVMMGEINSYDKSMLLTSSVKQYSLRPKAPLETAPPARSTAPVLRS